MEIDYDWEVLEIVNDEERGAIVRYTPISPEGLTVVEGFVAIPWHKFADAAQARDAMVKKLQARAPMKTWHKELNPDPPDNSEAIVAELESTEKPKGRNRAKPNTERGRNRARVPE